MSEWKSLVVMLMLLAVFGWLGSRIQRFWEVEGSMWLLAPTLFCYTLAALATFGGFLALLAMLEQAAF